MDNGGIRVVVSNPECVGQEYFEQEIGEEEEDPDHIEEDLPGME